MEKILIVEPDNLLCQEVMKQIREAGYTNLLSAFSGEEALKICQKEKPQLIILNMSLPDYFGLELPELIAQKTVVFGKPKIILLWDSFFIIEDPSILEKKYLISHTIRKPYKPEQVIEPVKNIMSAEIVAAPTSAFSQDIPVEYIQIFIESAENFFQTMTSVQPKVGQFFFKNDPFSQSDVSARMEIHGRMEGTICISFEKSVAVFVVSDMLQEEIAEFNLEVKDGIGEVVNIITGNTKSFFQKKHIPFEIGLPKIFTGKHYTHPLSPKVPCIVVPFITPQGTVFVEVCVQINENAKMEKESQAVPTISKQKAETVIDNTQPDINQIQEEIAAMPATETAPTSDQPPKPEPVAEEQPHATGPAITQAEIEKIQAEMAASKPPSDKKEPPPEQPEKIESPKPEAPAAAQPDINEIQAKKAAMPAPETTPEKEQPQQPEPITIKKPPEPEPPAGEPSTDKPQPASGSPLTQADIEKIQAEMAASKPPSDKKEPPPEQPEKVDPPKPEPPAAAQPDINQIQAEIAAIPSSETTPPKEQPPEPAIVEKQSEPEPPAGQPDINEIQAEIAAMPAAETTPTDEQPTQPEPVVVEKPPEPEPPAEQPPADDGKPKIILSKAPILKQGSRDETKTEATPKILSTSQPSINIEPKKPSTDYSFKPSEPNSEPSNLQPPTSDDEQKTDQP